MKARTVAFSFLLGVRTAVRSRLVAALVPPLAAAAVGLPRLVFHPLAGLFEAFLRGRLFVRRQPRHVVVVEVDAEEAEDEVEQLAWVEAEPDAASRMSNTMALPVPLLWYRLK